MFVYRLAVKLGIANVDRLSRSLTAKQLLAWEAYAEMEPFDERRADYRAASIVQVIANVNRDKKQKAYSIEDFVLKFDEAQKKEAPKQQSWQQQKGLAYMIAMAYSTAGANNT